MIDERLGMALGYCDVSGVNVYCDEEHKAEISKDFKEILNQKWEEALAKVEENEEVDEDFVFENNRCDIKIIDKEFGFFIKLTSAHGLEIYCFEEVLSMYGCGHDAFEESLEALKEKHPEIRYDGLILYLWSDWNDGGLIMYNISSDDTNKDKTYDFIGEKLSDIFEDAAKIIGEDFDENNINEKSDLLFEKSNIDYRSFWDYLLAGSGLKDKAIDSLKAYSDYINEDVFNNIINFITIHFKTYPY